MLNKTRLLTIAFLFTSNGLYVFAQPVNQSGQSVQRSKLINQQVYEVLAHPDFYNSGGIQAAIGQVDARLTELELEIRANRMFSDTVTQKYHELKSEEQQLNKKLAAIGSTTDVAGLLSSLSGQRMQLEIELAGLKSRRGALLEQQDRIESEAKELEKNDPILKQLMEIWLHSEKQLGQVTKLIEQNYAPESELANVRAKLAESKIRVEQRKEELRAKSSGNANGKQQLMELGLNISEIEAKLKVINDKFHEFSLLVDKQSQRDTLNDIVIPAMRQQMLDAELTESRLQNAMINIKSIQEKLKKHSESKGDNK